MRCRRMLATGSWSLSEGPVRTLSPTTTARSADLGQPPCAPARATGLPVVASAVETTVIRSRGTVRTTAQAAFASRCKGV
jgi:hypothetical protein